MTEKTEVLEIPEDIEIKYSIAMVCLLFKGKGAVNPTRDHMIFERMEKDISKETYEKIRDLLISQDVP